MKPVVFRVLAEKSEAIEEVRSHDTFVHLLALRLTDEKDVTIGALVAVHDIAHLEERATARMLRYALWIFDVTFLLFVLVTGITWLAYDRPLKDLAQWMRRLRTNHAPESPPLNLPVALLAAESEHLCHLAHERPTFRASDWSHYV